MDQQREISIGKAKLKDAEGICQVHNQEWGVFVWCDRL